MTDRRTALDPGAIALLLTCCGLWGLNQVATKVALADFPPFLQAGLRSAVAALLVLGWTRLRGLPLFGRDGSLAGGLLTGLLFAGEFGLIFFGLQYTTASRMVVFIYLAPFVVALGMPFVSPAERLSARQFGGLALAFAGVAAAFAEGFAQPSAGPRQWLGDACGVGAAVLWGATTLVIRGTPLASAAPEKTLLYQLGVSAVLLAGAAAVAGERWPQAPSLLSWGALGFQTVVVTFASYLMWFWLVRHYPATRIASFTLLTPIAGLLAGALLLDEPVTLRLVLALGTVVAGLVLVNRR
ncbi:DMT family transporter [Aquincola sp. MAHUQ-54]|uniref:DMT family transporter n=1 Tax=Aquincola agrisoli TaxID=3119538 RepID=A0AAW9QCL9_9BURK